MSEAMDQAIAEFHARCAPGPGTGSEAPGGFIRRLARRVLLRTTRHVRAHQQQVDLALLYVIEAERDERRLATRTDRDLQEAIRELEARVAFLSALDRDLAAGIENNQRETDELVARIENVQVEYDAVVVQIEDDALVARVESAGLGARVEEVRGALDGWVDELTARPFMTDPSLLLERGDQGEQLGFRGRLELPPMNQGFEELFRGTEAMITERQRGYVACFTEPGPVLDLGCGRGEFLALLRDAGIDARGVDADPEMVVRSATHGVPVECLDALEYLEKQADGSLGGIFSAQFVEHLVPAEFVRLLRLAREKLRPGGVFVCETVNPHSVRALRMFWLDLTHHQPLYPEALLAWSGLVGFEDGRIVFPLGTGDLEADLRAQGEFAVVAYAPAVDETGDE